MQVRLLAALFPAACLFSACGFAPPAPPKPDDTKRVAINHGDPRRTSQDQQSAFHAKGSDALKIALTPTSTLRQDSVVVQSSNGVSLDAGQPPVVSVSLAPMTMTANTPNAAMPLSPVETLTAGVDLGQTKIVAPLAPTPISAPIALSARSLVASEAQANLPTEHSNSAEAVAAPEPLPEPSPQIFKEIWQIGPDDGTVRQALARWANKANWTFGPDQWEVNFDLPIQAPAEFEAESFQEATQALSQAVAMTESPIRPCFYGNRVLRIVPFTRSCNRSPATQP